MSSEGKHITPYKTYLWILGGLIILTLLSVAITNIELHEYTVAGAMIFAIVKSYIVLMHFMHLKHDKPMYRRMAYFVLLLFASVLFITFVDYFNR